MGRPARWTPARVAEMDQLRAGVDAEIDRILTVYRDQVLTSGEEQAAHSLSRYLRGLRPGALRGLAAAALMRIASGEGWLR